MSRTGTFSFAATASSSALGRHICKASSVPLLTFTRAATAELVKKLGTRPAGKRLKPSTIHSFAVSILLWNPNIGDFPKPLRIVDDWEMKDIIRPDFKSLFGIPAKKTKALFVDLAANWESLEACPRVPASVFGSARDSWPPGKNIAPCSDTRFSRNCPGFF